MSKKYDEKEKFYFRKRDFPTQISSAKAISSASATSAFYFSFRWERFDLFCLSFSFFSLISFACYFACIRYSQILILDSDLKSIDTIFPRWIFIIKWTSFWFVYVYDKIISCIIDSDWLCRKIVKRGSKFPSWFVEVAKLSKSSWISSVA